MTRGIVIACVLVAAAAAATFSMRACAERQPRRRPPVEWQPGTNYTVLGRPQPTSVAPGKVEVSEVFWYGCGHCYALDPALETWKQNKARVHRVRAHAGDLGSVPRQHARLYYTLQALGRDDLHPKVFDAIHRDGNMLAADTDEEARAMHLAFLKQHGVSEKQFNAAYDSPEVAKQRETRADAHRPLRSRQRPDHHRERHVFDQRVAGRRRPSAARPHQRSRRAREAPLASARQRTTGATVTRCSAPSSPNPRAWRVSNCAPAPRFPAKPSGSTCSNRRRAKRSRSRASSPSTCRRATRCARSRRRTGSTKKTARCT